MTEPEKKQVKKPKERIDRKALEDKEIKEQYQNISEKTGYKKYDTSNLFLSDDDPRRPPIWIRRVILDVFIGVLCFMLIMAYKDGVTQILTMMLITFFFALAFEPIIVFLMRHGWKRWIAALTCVLGTLLFLVVVIYLFGNLFIQQLLGIINSLPNVYADISYLITTRFQIAMPSFNELLGPALSSWGSSLANQVVSLSVSVATILFEVMIIAVFVYYLCAAGPRFKNAVLSLFQPSKQLTLSFLYDACQEKISAFLLSRIVLVFISTTFSSVVLSLLGVSYWLPLALFTGFCVQFIPIVGMYIGPIASILMTLSSNGIVKALILTVALITYQQVENTFISPRISSKALQINAPLAFFSVIAFGYVFGPIGAFIGLPAAAVINVVVSTFIRRHDIVVSEGEAAEKISESYDMDDEAIDKKLSDDLQKEKEETKAKEEAEVEEEVQEKSKRRSRKEITGKA